MNIVQFNQYKNYYKQGAPDRAELNAAGSAESIDGFVGEAQQGEKSHEQQFDVFKEFSRLDVPRKMALFDCIMLHRGFAYRNMMKNIWPHSNENDARALEMMLNARLNRLIQH